MGHQERSYQTTNHVYVPPNILLAVPPSQAVAKLHRSPGIQHAPYVLDVKKVAELEHVMVSTKTWYK